MNSHYCKVGTVRPNLNKNLNSTELGRNSIEEKTTKVIALGKLSKKTA